jgi:CheY-like chemotaxis protein
MIKKSILFVDDEEILAIIGKKILEKQGHEVTIFTYSVEALKIFCQTPYKFDIVITDYNMPQMNGGQLAIKIKKIRKNLPVILATGCRNFTEDNLTEWGIDGLIVKPYQQEEIINLVQHLLTSNDAEAL